jgi:hypothetical protein
MRKPLIIVLMLGALAFLASDARAVDVSLTKDQVNNVCNGKDYCQKPCGLNGEHTCEFGCGSKGCAGNCRDCGANASRLSVIQPLVLGVTGAKTSLSPGGPADPKSKAGLGPVNVGGAVQPSLSGGNKGLTTTAPAALTQPSLLESGGGSGGTTAGKAKQVPTTGGTLAR